MSLLISFFYLLLYIAVVMFIAYALLWVVRDWFNVAIDPLVLKFAQIIVALIVIIVVVSWVAGVLPYAPHGGLFR